MLCDRRAIQIECNPAAIQTLLNLLKTDQLLQLVTDTAELSEV